MASWYRVIRYYPDIVRGECINVGVIAFDEQRVLLRMLQDWSRVAAFDGGSLTQEHCQEWASPLASLTPQQARERQSHAMSCLQLDEPLASVTTVYSLLDRIGDRMLVESADA